MVYGVTFSGGTALGGVQLPIAQMLRKKLGLPAWSIGGSVGSLTSSFMASDDLDGLEHLWEQVEDTKFFQRRNDDIWNGVFTLKPLRQKLTQHRVASSLKTDCFTQFIDIASGRVESVKMNDVSIADRHDALIASCAQVGIHERTQYRNRWVADSGARNVIPLIPTAASKVDELHVVSCSPVTEANRFRQLKQEDINSGVEQVGALFGIMIGEVVLNDVSALVRWGKETETKVYFWAPSTWDEVGKPFDASKEAVRLRIASGRKIAASSPQTFW